MMKTTHILLWSIFYACRERGGKYKKEWHNDYIDDLLRSFFKEEDKKSNYNIFGFFAPNESKLGDHFRWREYRRLFQIKHVMLGVRAKLIQQDVKPMKMIEKLAEIFDWPVHQVSTFHYKGKLPPKRTPLEKRKTKRTSKKKPAKK